MLFSPLLQCNCSCNTNTAKCPLAGKTRLRTERVHQSCFEGAFTPPFAIAGGRSLVQHKPICRAFSILPGNVAEPSSHPTATGMAKLCVDRSPIFIREDLSPELAVTPHTLSLLCASPATPVFNFSKPVIPRLTHFVRLNFILLHLL